MVYDFRKELVDFVLSRISGCNELDEIVKTQPSKRFILGSLAAREVEVRNNNIADFEEKLNTEKASIRATCLRSSVLVKNIEFTKERKLRILVKGYVFFKISSDEINNEDENNLLQKFVWKRKNFEFPIEVIIVPDKIDYCYEINFSNIIKSCNLNDKFFLEIPEETWKASLVINIKEYEKDSSIIYFYLNNTSTYDKKRDKNVEKTLFDCKLRVDLGDINVTPFVEKYNYNGYKQRYFYYFRTFNCQSEFVKGIEKKIFETDNHYLFEQKKVETTSNINGCNLSFKSFYEKNWESKLEFILKSMEELYSKDKSMTFHTENNFLSIEGENRQVEFKELEDTLENFQTLINSFKNGFEAIKSNEHAKIAFENMNEVFENYYKNKLGADFSEENPPSWRVFQLVFIVSSIRSIVSEKDLDTVDVLHVATGGGKSEAYFGLIIFSMLYERLNGKQEGVTAIVKFPLRMLSIQQLERLSSIVIYADKLREDKKDIFKGTEFSIGYYVGNSDDFPDLYSKVRSELYKDSKFTKPKKTPVYSEIITYCPLCDYNKRGRVYIIDEPAKKRVLHQCEYNPNHVFHIYYSDREIFRYRPTVIVSTVDKWAGLSQQRRARALLGSNGSMCPDGHGFIPSGDVCEDKSEEGICKNVGLNCPASPGPILSIQDEIHLLKESFGTISSHFEGLIEEIVLRNSNGRKIKNIAMSATLNGIQSQIKELYKKSAFVISGDPQIIGNPSFDLFFKKKDDINRLIYGMIPNLRDNHYATLRTILHSIEFIDKEQRNFISDQKAWDNKYGMKNDTEAIQTFKDFLTILTYHLKKQDAEDMSRFSDAVINDALIKEANITINGIVLTGDKGLDELKKTIDNIKRKYTDYCIKKQISPEASYEPVFSTSVVSHGIDLEELNFIVFQGIPYTTSEYIQALSRVGRSHEGIVLVWLYPNRVRDGSFFKNFKRYHESLDHEVLPAPIKRNSKLGIKQTANSLFCAGIIQFLSNKHGKPLIYKKNIEELTSNDKQELIQFIKSSYGKNVNLNIEREVENRINQICESHNSSNEFFPNVLSKSGEYYYRNQSGMRGIQESLILKPKGNTRTQLQQLKGGN